MTTKSKHINGNKYCAFEIDGEAKYYVCPKNEYCCNLGCCVNLAFQFYQMWYYWLLLILMFMICSGGGWWYRFCRQPDGSTYPSISQHTTESRTNQLRRPLETNRRSRVIHNLSMDHTSLYLQHIWKGQTSCQPPPNYYNNGTSVLYHNSSTTVDNDLRQQTYRCPYYQLYGPPPSYDSVVQISDTSNSTGQSQTCVLLTSQTSNLHSNNCNNTSIFNDLQQPSTSCSTDETAAIMANANVDGNVHRVSDPTIANIINTCVDNTVVTNSDTVAGTQDTNQTQSQPQSHTTHNI